MEYTESGGSLWSDMEGDENHFLRVLPAQSGYVPAVRGLLNITPSGHSSELFEHFGSIRTPYGFLELEDLAAMLETTVDYVIHEFMPFNP